jgi:DNA-binding GntR family transcriptional regulator
MQDRLGLADLKEGPRTLASAIYAELRADIMACRLEPGSKIQVAAMARRFNVSLAAVREALCRLLADGQVTSEDQKGFRVRAVSLRDLRDLVETRVEIETLALRRAIQFGDEAWRLSVSRAWDLLSRMPYTTSEQRREHNEGWSAAHESFHAALAAGCGLERLMQMRETLYEQSERYRRLALRLHTEPRDVAAEHRAIVEATLAGNPALACALLAEHLRRTARGLTVAYQDQIEPSAFE